MEIHDEPNVDDIINWVDEANAIINDVKRHVAEIKLSENIPNTNNSVYLNICTIEGNAYCVEVSGNGFRIVGNTYDTIDADKVEWQPPQTNINVNDNNNEDDTEEIFETPYALLDKISPRYVESFGNELCKQLLQLQQMNLEFKEEDEEENIPKENMDKVRKWDFKSFNA